MDRSSPFRSTMNTNVITALGMCKVWTEAAQSVALWTWTLSQLWACVKYEHENAKTRKREESTCGRENGENAKTAKTRKPRKRGKRENCENPKTRKRRKRENGENPKTRKRRKPQKPENGQKCSCFLVFNFSFSGFLGFLGFLVFSFGENAKTAKTRKPRKRGKRENCENPKTRRRRKRENGENPKTRKRRKPQKLENGQKCSCFLVFNFSFSGFLGFLGFLVFSFSGFLVPLAAPFWPGRVFYVLRETLVFGSSTNSAFFTFLRWSEYCSTTCLKWSWAIRSCDTMVFCKATFRRAVKLPLVIRALQTQGSHLTLPTSQVLFVW